MDVEDFAIDDLGDLGASRPFAHNDVQPQEESKTEEQLPSVDNSEKPEAAEWVELDTLTPDNTETLAQTKDWMVLESNSEPA